MTIGHRLLLLAYPRRFRRAFRDDLVRFLSLQRAEARYLAPGGERRFWRDAIGDAIRTGRALRVERTRAIASRVWRGDPGRGDPRFRRDGHQPVRRGGAEKMLDALTRDLRGALRGLAKNPGYALVFIATLGLGIGANTAMFSAVNGVLLRPLPHEDGDRLVYLRHTARLGGIENALFSVPEIEDYRQGTPSLDAVAEFSALTFTMLGHETPRRVRAGIVSGNYFEVMGLGATRGRVIGREDDGAAAAAIVVLSDAYWRNVFGGDPDVLGRTVAMNGLTATIVGVAEPAPPYPERTDIYVNVATSPHHLDAAMTHDRIHRMTEVFAKLAPGAAPETVRDEASLVSSRIHADYPEAYDAGSGYEVTVTPLKTQLTSRARPTLLILLATASLVLVIACANLANLTLTRVLRREDELAIRASLGAGRATLRRSLLVENLLLVVGGAAVGVMIASVGLDLLVAFAERFTSRAMEISFDGSVFGFALAAALGATAFFTLLPPLPDGGQMELTRSGVRSTGSARARGLQRGLVVAQIATSFVLLIGAGLLLRTMMHLNEVDPGFDTVEILSMDVPPDWGGTSPADLQNRYLAVLDEVRALPGASNAALTSAIPLTGESSFTTLLEIGVEGHEPAPGAPAPRADFRAVSEAYFGTMGIELLRGRDFTTTDTDEAQEVIIINESMARAYFGDRDPIGRRVAWTDATMRLMGEGTEPRTIVGVVADTRDAGLDAEVVHTVYNPYRQITPFYTGSLVVRTPGNAAGLVAPIRDIILGHDPDQPIANVATIADLGSESIAPQRLNTILLGAFAALALIIAAVGIGGVLAFSVGSRTREFGVRSALGAARHQIWSGVVAEGARLAALGLALGTLTALVLARFISGLLFGVPALDPATFLAVGLLLTGVAVGAAWIPAWRAAAVSPLEAMRAQ
ncbi:MAG: ABC transporter permease [Gemmatimonadetes bacterium]|nr:ABC transporter permease [Gemmatimonadota bacterium]